MSCPDGRSPPSTRRTFLSLLLGAALGWIVAAVPVDGLAKGQHADPCPMMCRSKDERCRKQCNKDADCLRVCAVDKAHCPDLCKSMYELAQQPTNYNLRRRFNEVKERYAKDREQLVADQFAEAERELKKKQKQEQGR